MFIENIGQFEDSLRFQGWGGSGTVWLTDDGLWVTLSEETGTYISRSRDGEPSLAGSSPMSPSRQGIHLRLSFVGANPQPHLEPLYPLGANISYFFGKIPRNWWPDVPVWRGARYVDLYPDIDLEFLSQNGYWVWRILPRNGAPLSQVRLRIEGADTVQRRANTLYVMTRIGVLSLPLLAVDNLAPHERPIVTRTRHNAHEVTAPFSSSPAVPPALPTVGVSDLLYSTFVGGSGQECWYWTGCAFAMDKDNAVYVTGASFSMNLPARLGAYSYETGPASIFVAKLSDSGRDLLYGTFIGGSGTDLILDIAVDENGSAYLVGRTESADYPITPEAFDATFNGDLSDAFVTKISPAGDQILYSTFLGGSSEDEASSVAVTGGNGTAYVVGLTSSDDFPVTSGAFDEKYNGNGDLFVAKIALTGGDLLYSTFIGGSEQDCESSINYTGCAITINDRGLVYITGATRSPDFPVTADALDTAHHGSWDAFIVQLSALGNTLVHATFIGGSGNDLGYSILVDGNQLVYITGDTRSADFPVTSMGTGGTLRGAADAFITKLDISSRTLVYSTLIGGRDLDWATDLSISPHGTGEVWLTGWTYSSNFPTTAQAFDTDFPLGCLNQAFVMKLNAAGTALTYSTYLGGGTGQGGMGIVVDEKEVVHVVGTTWSDVFPVTMGAYDTSYNGSADIFVAGLALTAPFDSFSTYLPIMIR